MNNLNSNIAKEIQSFVEQTGGTGFGELMGDFHYINNVTGYSHSSATGGLDIKLNEEWLEANSCCQDEICTCE